jgi:ParB-like chromosome segregation protein Spo0J
MATKVNPRVADAGADEKPTGDGGLSAATLAQSPDVSPFQVMPPLTADEYAALREDIASHGVLVPITVDQHGTIIDGHHRQQIASELGVPCPRVVQGFTSDEKRYELALGLNLKRRHLTREQFRELIAPECERTPEASDREIGRRLGCSHRTVAAVRRPVDNLSTARLTREEAEALTDIIQRGLDDADRSMRDLLHHCFSGGVSPADLAKILQSQRVKWMAETADYSPKLQHSSTNGSSAAGSTNSPPYKRCGKDGRSTTTNGLPG